MTELIFDDDHLRSLYRRVVEEPNRDIARTGFIRCPLCMEEILMIPTLRVMNEAIEKHVQKHKQELKENPIKAHQTAIAVRLSLTGQVLRYACRTEIS